MSNLKFTIGEVFMKMTTKKLAYYAMFAALTAVSYTHLDVYKRQYLFTPAGSPAHNTAVARFSA